MKKMKIEFFPRAWCFFFHLAYFEQYSWTTDIECLMDTLIFLNKYHDELVDKIGDEYNLPVVDLDRL